LTYLLDTNVISEWTKPRPDHGVVAWLEATDESSLYLSVVAFAEIRLGIELLPKGRKRDQLTRWLEADLARRFEGRVIEIDQPIAAAWGEIVARGRARGAAPPILDAFLMATAVVHGMTLVTRNLRDVQHFGVDVLDPWQT
jgi:predicted nucleic acid-binding protein